MLLNKWKGREGLSYHDSSYSRSYLRRAQYERDACSDYRIGGRVAKTRPYRFLRLSNIVDYRVPSPDCWRRLEPALSGTHQYVDGTNGGETQRGGCFLYHRNNTRRAGCANPPLPVLNLYIGTYLEFRYWNLEFFT